MLHFLFSLWLLLIPCNKWWWWWWRILKRLHANNHPDAARDLSFCGFKTCRTCFVLDLDSPGRLYESRWVMRKRGSEKQSIRTFSIYFCYGAKRPLHFNLPSVGQQYSVIAIIRPPGTVVPGGLMFYCCFFLFFLFSAISPSSLGRSPWNFAIYRK